MLQQNLEFLERLKENNNRDWFEANRKTYEATRKELIKFTELLLTQVRSFDASVDVQNPKDCLFRIYRDVRFSKNKAPYKTAMGVVIQKGGKKALTVAIIFILSQAILSLAGAIIVLPNQFWMPSEEKFILNMNSFWIL